MCLAPMSLTAEPDSVVHFVSAINLAFGNALAFVQQSHQEVLTGSGAKNWTRLERCLRQAPQDIERELFDGLDHFGAAFSIGDEKALRALRRTLKHLQRTYDVYLNDSLDHQFDHDRIFQLFSASDLARKRVVRMLNNLYERLLEPTVLISRRRLLSKRPLIQAAPLHELEGDELEVDEPCNAVSRFSIWSTPAQTPVSPCEAVDLSFDLLEFDKRKGRQQSLFALFQGGLADIEREVPIMPTLSPASETNTRLEETLPTELLENQECVKNNLDESSSLCQPSIPSDCCVTAPADELRFSYDPIKAVANSKALRSTLVKISEISAAAMPKEYGSGVSSPNSPASTLKTTPLELTADNFGYPHRPKPTRSQSERAAPPLPPPPPPPKDTLSSPKTAPLLPPIMDPLRANPCSSPSPPLRLNPSNLSTSSAPLWAKAPVRHSPRDPSQQMQQKHMDVPTRPATIPQPRSTSRREASQPTAECETFFLASSPPENSPSPIQVALAKSKSVRTPLAELSALPPQTARMLPKPQRPSIRRPPTFPSMKPLPSLPRSALNEPKSEKLPCRSKFCIQSSTIV